MRRQDDVLPARRAIYREVLDLLLFLDPVIQQLARQYILCDPCLSTTGIPTPITSLVYFPLARSLSSLPDRVQKLKDARTEAAKEIEEYKAQKEAEFKKFESDVRSCAKVEVPRADPFSDYIALHICQIYRNAPCHRAIDNDLSLSARSPPTAPKHFTKQHTTQTSSSQSTIDSSTKEQLATLDAQVKEHGDEVIKKIVSRVLSVEPKLHPNLKKVEA